MSRMALLVAVPLLATAARAGPREAARLYEEARALGDRPWPVRATAYRAALDAARPTDPTHPRALAALATLFDREGFLHAALAFRARGASLGPERDEGRIGRELSLALLLRSEGELDSARPHLEAVLEAGRNVAPRKAQRALVALAEDARDREEHDRLETLYRQSSRGRYDAYSLLRVLDAVGTGRLARADTRGARRILDEARRLWREALEDDDPRQAARVSRLWLDLDLRRALSAWHESEANASLSDPP